MAVEDYKHPFGGKHCRQCNAVLSNMTGKKRNITGLCYVCWNRTPMKEKKEIMSKIRRTPRGGE